MSRPFRKMRRTKEILYLIKIDMSMSLKQTLPDKEGEIKRIPKTIDIFNVPG